MRKNKLIIYVSIGVACVLTLLSCGPVHRFTTVKKVPRKYELNYCGGEIKAPLTRSWFKGNPWIVYSDKPGNMTYQSPTGKNEMKQVQYMDAFLVIKRKDDWLKVIKYDPAILHNGKLKEWKKAKYCGWIHKNNLLLTRSSITDIGTGFKNKMVTLLSDTIMLREPSRFFESDSVLLFKNPDLTQEQTKIPLYSLVFPLKKTKDGNSVLIARKGDISPDSIQSDVLGWVDKSLLVHIGQQLHIDVTTLPKKSLEFKDKENDTLFLSNREFEESLQFSANNKALAFSPVLAYAQRDTNICIRTQIPMSMIDKRSSYVLNVNGSRIYYERFKEIEKSLGKINVVFVMEGKEEVIQQYPSLVNVVQSLQPVLTSDEMFSLRFGAVLTFNERNNPTDPVCPLTSDYMKLLDFMSEKSKNAAKLTPVYGIHGNWSGLKRAVNMFNKCPDETNIVVVVGDKGYNSEWADSTLVNQMVRNNCRLLGFQLHSGDPDNFNNFVLQVGNMIDNYAPKISKQKREIIVYADQLRNSNEYKETVKKNAYCLDFPARSMTQGWLVFPQKNETRELEELASSVDSMLVQVKYDNTLLVNSLYQAFEEVGHFRHKMDSTFADYHRIYYKNIQPFLSVVSNVPAEWNLPAQPIVLPDSISTDLGYHLLLTEDEFKSLRKFMDKLASYDVDYKYEAKEKAKRKKIKICDCPEGFMFVDDTPEGMSPSDSLETKAPEYASTRKVRIQLMAQYLAYANSKKYCKLKHKVLKRMPISEVQRRLTSCPTDNPFLKTYRIKDLKDRNMISDELLDYLLQYFKEKKKELDKAAGKSFQSNGQTYYWVDRKMLP